MATNCVWVGTTNTVWGTAANWNPAGVPAAGSTAVIPKEATVAVTGSTAAVFITGLYVEDGCSVALGTAASPLIVGMKSTGTVVLAGTGTTYLQVKGEADGGPATINVQACGNLYLTSYPAVSMGSTLNITAPSGNVYVGWGADDAAHVDAINIIGSAVNTYIGRNTAALTTLTAKSGTLDNRAAVTTFNVWGGSAKQVENSTTTANIYGGTLKYNTSKRPTTFNVYSDGTLDLSENPGTIATTTVNVYGAAKVDDSNNVLTVGSVFNFNQTNADAASVNFGTHRKATTAAI